MDLHCLQPYRRSTGRPPCVVPGSSEGTTRRTGNCDYEHVCAEHGFDEETTETLLF